MSSDYDIKMNLNDTLELDAIIQEWSTPSNVIEESEAADSYDLNGFQTKTGVFDPKGSGTYKFKINGQILNIKVIDNSQIPDGSVYRWSVSDGSGSELTDSISTKNITQSDNFKWVSGDYRGGYAIDLDSSTFATASAISEIQSTKDWTVSCTVNVDSFVNDGVIWFNGGANAFDDSDFFIGTEGDRITLDNYTSNNNRIQIASISGLTTSKNYRVVFTWDSSTNTPEAYINGNSVTTGENKINFNGRSTNKFCIGKEGNTTGPQADVILDDLVIYNKKLSGSEINDDYKAQPWS